MSEKAKFTAGPWEADFSGVSGQGGYPKIRSSHHVGAIAEVNSNLKYEMLCDGEYCERKANAHLIAAAPDLLEALTDAVIDFDNWAAHEDNHPHEHLVAWAEKARAAIAKARGES